MSRKWVPGGGGGAAKHILPFSLRLKPTEHVDGLGLYVPVVGIRMVR